MSVNVSAQQLMAPDFVATVAEVLAATETPPGLLTLEITEGAFVQDPKRALVVLNDLKELGVLLALDDFGTGYSSLSYLKQFPVDILKIDRTFTADLVHDQASHAIVTKIIELAHMLDLLGRHRGRRDGGAVRGSLAAGQRVLPGLLLCPSDVGREFRWLDRAVRR